jgi:hypothetical protein
MDRWPWSKETDAHDRGSILPCGTAAGTRAPRRHGVQGCRAGRGEVGSRRRPRRARRSYRRRTSIRFKVVQSARASMIRWLCSSIVPRGAGALTMPWASASTGSRLDRGQRPSRGADAAGRIRARRTPRSNRAEGPPPSRGASPRASTRAAPRSVARSGAFQTAGSSDGRSGSRVRSTRGVEGRSGAVVGDRLGRPRNQRGREACRGRSVEGKQAKKLCFEERARVQVQGDRLVVHDLDVPPEVRVFRRPSHGDQLRGRLLQQGHDSPRPGPDAVEAIGSVPIQCA